MRHLVRPSAEFQLLVVTLVIGGGALIVLWGAATAIARALGV